MHENTPYFLAFSPLLKPLGGLLPPPPMAPPLYESQCKEVEIKVKAKQ